MASEAQRIPVLMYHRVGSISSNRERRYCLSPGLFAGQMHRLASLGIQACSMHDFTGWLRKENELPEGSFLITFDDGFLGVYEHAAAILGELGWPATVFLVSRRIGRINEWNSTGAPGITTHPLLAREQIETMRSSGFSFQSHTRTHASLTDLPDDRLAEELAGSRRDLEELLGEEVLYLAYPYGHHDDRVISASRSAGYAAAFSTQPGFNRHSTDRYRIHRLDVYGTDTPRMLSRKVLYGSNDGSWQQTYHYYRRRITEKLGV